ncbi:MAG: hypothetical protein AAGC47_02300 [Bacteroidota bacterium]
MNRHISLIFVFALLSMSSQSQPRKNKNPRGGYRGLSDRVQVYDIGISFTSYYTSSKVENLQETFVRDQFFQIGDYSTSNDPRTGLGIALSIPVQWHRFAYSQAGIFYEWPITDEVSDFSFNNLLDPQKSYQIWLNYRYFGFSFETGASISLPNKGEKGLMFEGWTLNLGLGFRWGFPTGEDFVKYESASESFAGDSKIQDDLKELLSSQNSRLVPYIISRVGYKFVFAEFIWNFSEREALITDSDNIYNLKENENKRTSYLFGVGFRLSMDKRHRQRAN